MAALKSRRLVIVLLGVIAAATLGVLTFQTVDLWPERHTNGWGPLGSEGTATMGFDSAAPGWSIGIPLCLAKGQQPAVLDGSVSGASTTGSGLRYLGAVVRQGTPTLGFRVIGAVEGFPPPAPFNAYHSEKGFAVTTPCQEGPNPSLSVPYTELDLGIAHPIHMDAFAVVINGHGEFLLGSLLADDVLIEVLLNFQGFRELVGSGRGLIGAVVFQD